MRSVSLSEKSVGLIISSVLLQAFRLGLATDQVLSIIFSLRLSYLLALATDVSVFVSCIDSLAHGLEELFALVLRG